jgi:hypothetical protein
MKLRLLAPPARAAQRRVTSDVQVGGVSRTQLVWSPSATYYCCRDGHRHCLCGWTSRSCEGLTTFDWWVKSVHVADLGDVERSALRVACPLFTEGGRRRFAGDSTLPYGRYHTVLNEGGVFNDNCLVNELLAYHDPMTSGVVLFVDHMDEAGRAAYAEAKIRILPSHHVALVFPNVTNESPIARTFRIPAGGLLVAEVPYRVYRLKIEKTVDLRQVVTQEWFVRTFGRKRQDNFLLKPAKAVEFDSFAAMLPTFFHETRGGSDFTAGFAGWMRHHGADALVFPSARSNAGVEYVDGVLTRFTGWNLVIYTGSPPVEYDFAVEMAVAYDMRVSPKFQVRYAEQGPYRGSWMVAGVHESLEERLNRRREKARQR